MSRLTRINSKKRRKRTAVTTYLRDEVLQGFEDLMETFGEGVSVSEFVELGILSLIGMANDIYATSKSGSGVGCTDFKVLKTFIALELEARMERVNSLNIFDEERPADVKQ